MLPMPIPQTGAPLISKEISERREESAIRNFSQALLPLGRSSSIMALPNILTKSLTELVE